ncbi:hemagglutinin repeat-containing protein (plasmid) [Paraburkholderia sp. PREW-6R]|uniref:two-partner secretion domain-containing protein n=1 Tax=Paraburkholderia sp. PREW-6R TaxID=3141544 RepID=UPI0031F4CA25
MQNSSNRRYPQWRRIVAWAVIMGQVWAVPLRALAQVTPKAGGQTQVYTNPNGVSVVDIAKPNSAGLSYNQYTQYNVDGRGLVLNNNPTPVTGGMVAPNPSQLAGSMLTNPNLTTGATVILNEVVSPNRSVLAGYTEVSGQRADVVVANPYGITCNGCGFINTGHATLTTGTPVLGANGALAGFNVTGGDILVQGTGLDATNPALLDLVSRSIKLDGQVNGHDVTIATGNGTFSVDSRVMTPTTSSSGAPALAIDSTALGGMYADRIKIVSTEAGVGVRMAGPVSATAGDVAVQSAGQLTVQGPMSASGNVQLASTSGGANAVSLSGAQLTAGQNLGVSALAGGVNITGGQLQAKAGNLTVNAATLSDNASGATQGGNNTRSAGGLVQLSTTGATVLDNVGYQAGSSLSLQGGDVNFAGTSTNVAGQTVNIGATDTLALGQSSVAAAGDIALAAGKGGLTYNGGAGQAVASQNGRVSIVSAGALNQAGTVSATQGSLSVQSAGPLTNTGELSAGGAITVSDTAGGGTQSVTNAGSIASGGTLDMNASTLMNSGAVQSNGATTVVAQQLANSGTLRSLDTLDATVAGALGNSGTIASQNALRANSSSLSNSGAVGSVSSDVQLNVGQIDNAGGISAQKGTLSIGNGGSAAGTALTNESSGQLVANGLQLRLGTLTNAGQIAGATAAGAIAVSGQLNNESGAIITVSQGGGAVPDSVSAGTLNNSGVLQSGSAMNVSAGAGGLSNSTTGTVLAVGNLVVHSAGSVSNDGSVTGTNVTVSDASGGSSESLTNTGKLVAGGSLSVAAGTVNNSGSVQSAVGGNVAAAGQLANSGTIYLGAQSGDSTVTAAQLTNQAGSTLYAGQGLTTSVSGNLTNAGQLGAQNALQVNADSVTNQAGAQLVSNTRDATLVSNSVTNAGTISAQGNLSLTGASAGTLAVTNAASGTLIAGQKLTVQGQNGSGNATLTNVASNTATNTGNAQQAAAQGTVQGDALDLRLAQLANSGQITGGSAQSQVNVSGVLRNDSGALLALNRGTTGAVTSTVAAGTIDNSGVLQGTGAMNVSAGAGGLSNSTTGTVLAVGNLVVHSAGSVSNDGSVTGTNVTVSDASGGSSESLTNTGKLVAGGSLSVAAGTVNNSGSVQSAVGGNVAAAGQLANSGTIYLGAQSGDSTVTAAQLTNQAGSTLYAGQGLTTSVSGNLTNAGQLGAQNALQVNADSVTNQAGAQLVSNTRDATLVSNSVTNAGTISAQGNLSLTGASAGTLAVTNAASGTLIAGQKLTVQGQNGSGNATLTNAASNTATNTGNAQQAAAQGTVQGGTLNLNLSTLTNSGSIAGLHGSTLAVSGTLDNQAGGTLTLAQDAGAQSAVTAGTLSNEGRFQDMGTAQVTARKEFDNSGATVLGQGDVGAPVINNNGTLEAQQDLQLRTSTLDIGNGALVASGGTLGVNATSVGVADGGTMQSVGNADISTTALTFGGANAGLLLAQSGGQATLNVNGALNNPGLVFSGGDLTVNASSVNNAQTGAISALGKLNVDTGTGDIINAGQLYSHQAINLNAGTVTNVGTLSQGIGQIDSDGDLTVTANSFNNNSEINVAGNATVSAAQFSNSVAGGDTRQWLTPDVVSYNNDGNGAQVLGVQVGAGSGYGETSETHWDSGLFDSYTERYYQANLTNTQYYAGGTPTYQPKFVAGNTLTVQNFDHGENLGAVLSGRTVNLTGNSGATFTNDNLALLRKDYTATWDTVQHISCFIFCTYYDPSPGNLQISSQLTQQDAQAQLTAAIYAGQLNASGNWSLTNRSTPYQLASAVFKTPAAPAGSAYLAVTTGGASTVGANAAQGASLQAAAGKNGITVATNGTQVVSYRTPPSVDVALDLGNGQLWLAGAVVNLPTNPNGLFVPDRSSNASYVVETNPRYLLGTQSVGTDYLIQQLYGYTATQTVKLLGDANYEASLVSQEMAAQTGLSLETAFVNQADQMKGLMDNAVAQAPALGLKIGVPLTGAQVAQLKQDIVWAVDTQVNGQTVQVPMLYLAPGAHQSLPGGGAVIMAANTSLNLDSLTNQGGTIAASQLQKIQVQGDLNNVGGAITGQNVSLASVGGSVNNTTLDQGGTLLGSTAQINAGQALGIQAGQDIVLKGSSVTAGGNAGIVAGRDLVLSTAVTSTSSTSSGPQPGTVIQTTATQNQGSILQVGGSLGTQSGRNTTLTDATVKTGGDLSMVAAGNLDVLDAQNTATVHSQSGSGNWMNHQTTTTDAAFSQSAGTTIQTGGNASLQSGQTLTMRAAAVNAGGDLSVTGQNVKLLAGQDTQTTSASTQSSSLFSAPLQFYGSTSTQSNTYDSWARASQLSAGGNVTVAATGDVTSVGTTVQAGTSGNVLIQGANVNLLAAQDVHTTSTQSQSTSIGLSSSGSVSMATTGTASATPDNLNDFLQGMKSYVENGISAKATAQAGASGQLLLGMTQSSSSESTLQIKNHGTQLNGQNISVVAGGTLTSQASAINAGNGTGNVVEQAGNILNVAANDVSQSSSSSQQSAFGLALGGSSNGSAHAGMSSTITGTTYGTGASADNKATLGFSDSSSSDTQSVRDTTAVVNTIIGKNVTQTAGQRILNEGTQIQTGADGSVSLQAQTLDFLAAANTHTESSSHSEQGFNLGVSLDGNTSVQSGGGGGLLKPGGVAQGSAGAQATVGFDAGANWAQNSYAMGSSQAVVGSINAGSGGINLDVGGKATLEGTNLSTGGTGDLTIRAGQLDYEAAHDTSWATSQSSSTSVGLSGGVGVQAGMMTQGGASVSPMATLNASVQHDQANSSMSSSDAIVGNVNVGNLSVTTTQGDMRFEGTDLNVTKNLQLDSAGQVLMDAAHDTSVSSSSSRSVGAGAGVQIDPEHLADGTFVNGSGQIGFASQNQQSTTAQVGNVTVGGNSSIRGHDDVAFEGTQIQVGGNSSIVSTGGNVKFLAAQSTATAASSDAQLDVSSAGMKDAQQTSVDGSFHKENSNDVTNTLATLKVGGTSQVQAKQDVVQDGNVLGSASVVAGGALVTNAVQDVHTSSEIGFTFNNGVSQDTQPVNHEAAAGQAGEIAKARTQAAAVETKVASGKATEIAPLSTVDDLANVANILPVVAARETLVSGATTGLRELTRYGLTALSVVAPTASMAIGAATMTVPLAAVGFGIHSDIIDYRQGMKMLDQASWLSADARESAALDLSKQATKSVVERLLIGVGTLGGAAAMGATATAPSFAHSVAPAYVDGQVYAWSKAVAADVFPLETVPPRPAPQPQPEIVKPPAVESAGATDGRNRANYIGAYVAETAGGMGMDIFSQGYGYNSKSGTFNPESGLVTGLDKSVMNSMINTIETTVGMVSKAHYEGNAKLDVKIGFNPTLFGVGPKGADGTRASMSAAQTGSAWRTLLGDPSNVNRSNLFGQLYTVLFAGVPDNVSWVKGVGPGQGDLSSSFGADQLVGAMVAAGGPTTRSILKPGALQKETEKQIGRGETTDSTASNVSLPPAPRLRDAIRSGDLPGAVAAIRSKVAKAGKVVKKALTGSAKTAPAPEALDPGPGRETSGHSDLTTLSSTQTPGYGEPSAPVLHAVQPAQELSSGIDSAVRSGETGFPAVSARAADVSATEHNGSILTDTRKVAEGTSSSDPVPSDGEGRENVSDQRQASSATQSLASSDKNSLLEPYSPLRGVQRFVGHHDAGSGTLGDLTPAQIADLVQPDTTHVLLAGCRTGCSIQGDPSFAQKVQNALQQRGVGAQVTGFTTDLAYHLPTGVVRPVADDSLTETDEVLLGKRSSAGAGAALDRSAPLPTTILDTGSSSFDAPLRPGMPDKTSMLTEKDNLPEMTTRLLAAHAVDLMTDSAKILPGLISPFASLQGMPERVMALSQNPLMRLSDGRDGVALQSRTLAMERLSGATKNVVPIDAQAVRPELDMLLKKLQDNAATGSDSATMIDDLNSRDARKVLPLFGASAEQIEQAQSGNVVDVGINTLAKQAVNYPTRLITQSALSVFAELYPEPKQADFGSSTSYEEALASWKDAQWKVGKVAGLGRGLGHYTTILTGGNIDLASRARAFRAKLYPTGGNAYEDSLRNLDSIIKNFEQLLADEQPGIEFDAAEVSGVVKNLQSTRDELKALVDDYMQQQRLMHPGDRARMDAAVTFAAEVFDSAGKVALGAALATVDPLSAAAVKQSWSLVSYTLMEQVRETLHLAMDTKAIAKIALKKYADAIAAAPNQTDPQFVDHQLQSIAEYVQSHFESADQANYKRFIDRVLIPTTIKQAADVSEMEKEIRQGRAAVEALNPTALELAQQKGALEDRADVLKGKLLARIASNDEALSAGMGLMKAIQAYTEAGDSSPTRQAVIDTALKGGIEALLYAFVAPAEQPKNVTTAFQAALQARGVDVSPARIFSLAREFSADLLAKNALIDGIDFVLITGPHPFVSHTPSGKAKLANQSRIDGFIKLRQYAEELHAIPAKIEQTQREFEDAQLKPASTDGSFRSNIGKIRSRTVRLEQELPVVREAQSDYQRQAHFYLQRQFNDLDWRGQLGQQLASGSKGITDGITRRWKYQILTSARNKAYLGLALGALYTGGLSQFVLESNGIAQAMVEAGEAGTYVTAAVHSIRPDGTRTRGFAGVSPVQTHPVEPATLLENAFAEKDITQAP